MVVRNLNYLELGRFSGNQNRKADDMQIISVVFLDMVLKEYIKKVKDNSESMLHILEEELKYEERSTESGRVAEEELRDQIEMAREELKTLARQKMRDIARHKGNTDVLEETYDSLIEEANNRIEGLTNQLAMVADATNSIIRVNRISKTVIEATLIVIIPRKKQGRSCPCASFGAAYRPPWHSRV